MDNVPKIVFTFVREDSGTLLQNFTRKGLLSRGSDLLRATVDLISECDDGIDRNDLVIRLSNIQDALDGVRELKIFPLKLPTIVVKLRGLIFRLEELKIEAQDKSSKSHCKSLLRSGVRFPTPAPSVKNMDIPSINLDSFEERLGHERLSVPRGPQINILFRAPFRKRRPRTGSEYAPNHDPRLIVGNTQSEVCATASVSASLITEQRPYRDPPPLAMTSEATIEESEDTQSFVTALE